MTNRTQRFPALLMLLTLSGCATLPSGPSVMVLPAQGKSFEVFQSEDALCRSWAERQTDMSSQEYYNQNATTGAAVGTVLGAGIGALLGAASGNPGAGAAIGAGGGLLVGTASGSENAQASGYQAQRRYDNSYLQCMYAKGNQIPGTTQKRINYRRHRVAAPPPPPPGYQPPPMATTPPDYPPDYYPQQ